MGGATGGSGSDSGAIEAVRGQLVEGARAGVAESPNGPPPAAREDGPKSPDRPGLTARLRRAFRGSETPAYRRDVVLADRLDTLLAIARRLTETLDRREVFRTIVEEANRALDADGTTIRIVDGTRLELTAWAGMTDERVARLPTMTVDDPWFADVIAHGAARATEDVARSGRRGYERWVGDLAFSGELAVPLVYHDRVLGVLRSITRAPREWSADDVEFVAALAAHAAIAIHNAELFERTESRAEQLAVLQAASARMNAARTVDAVGRAIVEETRRLLEYHNARVYVVEPPNAVVPIAFEGRMGEYDIVDLDVLRTTLGVGFTGWVAQRGEPLLIPNANEDPRGVTIPGTDDIDESMLVVPMRADDEVVGVITLSKLGLAQFDEEDLQLLTILADQAATALESARVVARSEAVRAELQLIVEMSSALSGTLDPRQVANLIAEHIARAMSADECAISYWDRAGRRVVTLGYYPAEAADDLEPFFDIAGFPETRRVLETQSTSIIDAADPRADRAEVALLRREGNRMLAMLPLVAKGQSIGLVELMSKTGVLVDEARLTLARTMANEAAMALENARLYEEARTLADRDPLTGFYNHRFFHERLGEEVVRAQRTRQPLSLLMLDLDDFKLVNDTLGHLFGDRVLAWVAERIRSTLRLSDIAARYGGDEFAIILPDTDIESAQRTAGRILETFRDHKFETEGRGPLPIGVSIGVATHPVDGRTPTQLIAAADRQLYRVKRSGRQGGHGSERTSGPAARRPASVQPDPA